MLLDRVVGEGRWWTLTRLLTVHRNAVRSKSEEADTSLHPISCQVLESSIYLPTDEFILLLSYTNVIVGFRGPAADCSSRAHTIGSAHHVASSCSPIIRLDFSISRHASRSTAFVDL